MLQFTVTVLTLR